MEGGEEGGGRGERARGGGEGVEEEEGLVFAREDGLGGVSGGATEGTGRTWSRRRASRFVNESAAVLGDGWWRTVGG